MSMISEQVADLREKAQIFEDSGCATNGIVKTFRKAADTIEQLSEKLAINSQPPAEQWIPCDIARPTESGIYWATVEVYWCDEPVSIQLEYNHKKDEWIGGYDVIAWMPAILPEPYKGE